ncbi:MAG TPA: hypothetical protein VM689_15980 [Aliidongia sp.]|nr:hypothetical protein [Aliidongia sp.]
MATLKSLLCLALSFFAATAGCAAAEPQGVAQLPYTAWDSGLAPYTFNKFYWLDDDTLFFRASTGLKPHNKEESVGLTLALNVWRLGDKPRPYVTEQTDGRYCAAKGKIRYFTLGLIPGQVGFKTTATVEGAIGVEEHHPPPQVLEREDIPRQGLAGNNPEFIESAENCVPPADPQMAGEAWITDCR